jgi:hypothetical protein
MALTGSSIGDGVEANTDVEIVVIIAKAPTKTGCVMESPVW